MESDWNPSGSVPRIRNVTVKGDPSLAGYPTLRLAYVKGKVRLNNAISVTFQNLVLESARNGNPSRAPGINLFAPSTNGGTSEVVLQNVVVIMVACYPSPYEIANHAGMTRPPSYPGVQRYLVSNQTGCTNDTAAPLLQRCWPNVLLEQDVVTYATGSSEPGGSTLPNNLFIVLRNVTAVCQALLDLACIQKLGALGCLMATTKNISAAAAAAAAAANKTDTTSSHSSGSDGGSSSSDVLSAPSEPPARDGSLPPRVPTSSGPGRGGVGVTIGAVCGAVAGGAALAAALLVILVRRQRRRRRRSPSGSAVDGTGHTTEDGAAAAAAATLGTTAATPVTMIAVDAPPAPLSPLGPFPALNSGSAAATAATAQQHRAGILRMIRSILIAVLSRRSLQGLSPDGVRPSTRSSSVQLSNACDAQVQSSDKVGCSSAGTCGTGVGAGAPSTEEATTETGNDSGPCSASVQNNSSGDDGGRGWPQSPVHWLNAAEVPITPLTPQRGSLQLGVRLMSPADESPCSSDPVAGGSSPAEYGGGKATGGSSAFRPQQEPQEQQQQALAVVTLLPVTRGKGAYGRVMEGLYGGRKVAVKVVEHWSGLPLSPEPELQQSGAQPQAREQGQGQRWQRQHQHDGGLLAAQLLNSFNQEVEVLGRCEHPNVVRLLAACVTPPRLCLVMELMETSLEALMYGGEHRADLLPLPKVLHIATCVCRALAYLHPTVAHRDLKPANVLINDAASDTPVVKLGDFGLARLRTTVVPTRRPGAGTPPYMAPECYDIHNHTITHKADVYSLGVLLWEMLAGSRPWEACNVVEIALRVSCLQHHLPFDAIPADRCSTRLRGLMSLCWELDRDRRPAAAEVANELDAIMQVYAAKGSLESSDDSATADPYATP